MLPSTAFLIEGDGDGEDGGIGLMVEADDDRDVAFADAGNVVILLERDGLACAFGLEGLLGVPIGILSLAAVVPSAKGSDD